MLGPKIAEFLGVMTELNYSNGELFWITILANVNSDSLETNKRYYQHILQDKVGSSLENAENN